MSYHKKQTKCSCEKKTKEHKKLKEHHKPKESKEHHKPKESKEHHKHNRCECEPKYYFPLPNIPSQPVGGSKVRVDAWFAPGSVESCCSICSSVNPVYANPCNTCRYDKGVYPINNSAYYTTNQYIY
jgi:hypothetical protein